MNRPLIFGGTTEGRLLCEALAAQSVPAVVCVATEYGGEMLAGLGSGIAVRVGRLDAKAMEALMDGPIRCVIDATHPYAVEASQNIRAAAAKKQMSYYRLARASREAVPEGAIGVCSIEQAVAFLQNTQGHILATTGTKALDSYTALCGYAERVYPRVLPSEASIARCLTLGFRHDHIIAMQGPFSQTFNQAMMQHFRIQWLVTKESGDLGGFMAKIDAAAQCGARSVVIGRPMDVQGYTLDEMLALLLPAEPGIL